MIGDLLPSAIPGVETPGVARVLSADLDVTWLSIAPDGSIAITAGFDQDPGMPILHLVDLESGETRPMPPPAKGAVWLPKFLDSDGRSWRVVALWTGGSTSEQGLYTFRLDDPAGTWTPWAVTGTYVREFWLVEDGTELLMVSFVPDGKRDSDRVDVAPIVDGRPDLTRTRRIAPELRHAFQSEAWDERSHRFLFQTIGRIDDPTLGFFAVALAPGSLPERVADGASFGLHWNPNPEARDAVRVVSDHEVVHLAISEAGERRPMLQCADSWRCSVLGLSPVKRELYFVYRHDHSRHDLVATQY